jgi:hypothetical protein
MWAFALNKLEETEAALAVHVAEMRSDKLLAAGRPSLRAAGDGNPSIVARQSGVVFSRGGTRLRCDGLHGVPADRESLSRADCRNELRASDNPHASKCASRHWRQDATTAPTTQSPSRPATLGGRCSESLGMKASFFAPRRGIVLP